MITKIIVLALFVGAGANFGIAEARMAAKEQHTSIVSPVHPVADQKKTIVYKTHQGDTLASIAKRFPMKPEQLEQMNPNVDFTKLRVGQPIKVASVKRPAR
jgi:LysM repeat protein